MKLQKLGLENNGYYAKVFMYGKEIKKPKF